MLLNFFTNTKSLIIILVILSIPALLPMLHKGFFPLQDSILVARLYEAHRDLRDLQIPMRWAPDLRYGEPLFNFYAPLPYYIGGFVSFFHISYLNTSKLLLGLSIIFSGISMFFLAKELFGKIGAMIASVLYMYAPYHSVDIYVRGDLSETWVLIFFPLVFLFIYRLSKNTNLINTLLLAITVAGFFLTHTVTIILFMPFLIGWELFLLIQNKNKKLLVYSIISLLLAVGMASHYLLPAYFEKNLVESSKLTSGYYDFKTHFVEISQFFSTNWAYGPSVSGSKYSLSYQVGLLHWLLIGLTVVFLFIVKKFRKSYLWLIIFLLIEFFISLFLQTNNSLFIWKLFPVMSFIQFPWRFLEVTIFVSSLLIGSLGSFLNKNNAKILVVLLLIPVIYYVQFFHPQFFYDNRTDQDYIADTYLKNEGFIPRDFVPLTVKKTNDQHKVYQPQAISGEISVLDYSLHSSWATTTIKSVQTSQIEFPITYFPGWMVRENSRVIPQDQPNNLGLIEVTLPAGTHKLSLNFDNTLIRNISDGLSILCFFVFGFLMITYLRKSPS